MNSDQIANKIRALKEEKKTIILAHHYQSEKVKSVADYVGDSLGLAKIASTISAENLIVCGVYFMAETAKILSPQKRVFLSNANAGCPMADMVTPKALIEMKNKYPDAKVVTYVNSSADIKALSDICCTSSNAIEIVKSIPEKQILFVPDKNLGQFVQKNIPDKEIILWRGFCPTHHRAQVGDLENAKMNLPKAKVLIHPECTPDVTNKADFVGSTSQIIKYVEETIEVDEAYIIGTEEGVVESLKIRFPNKKFVALYPNFICPNMKKTTLNDVYEVLSQEINEVDVLESIQIKAFESINNMVRYSHERKL